MAKTTIWVVGAKGRLGSELVNRLKGIPGNKIIGTDIDVDITDSDAVEQAADIYRPNIIINCASISEIDECEADKVKAYKVNALGVRNLATASRRIGARIIQMSTDDVFDGAEEGCFSEFDTPQPKSVYAKSKLAGENYVRELNPKHLIIRSSWVYGSGSENPDYYKKCLDRASKGESFTAAENRISTPTSAWALAKAISVLIDEGEYGIFHASSEGECSRYEYARKVLELNGYDPDLVKPTSRIEDKSSTLLDNLMMKMTDVFEMPTWQEDMQRFVNYLKEEE